MEQVPRLFLGFEQHLFELMRPLELRDHLRVMRLPVGEDGLAEFVLVVHLAPPFGRARAVGPLPFSNLGPCS